jgi:hypothetical protein
LVAASIRRPRGAASERGDRVQPLLDRHLDVNPVPLCPPTAPAELVAVQVDRVPFAGEFGGVGVAQAVGVEARRAVSAAPAAVSRLCW